MTSPDLLLPPRSEAVARADILSNSGSISASRMGDMGAVSIGLGKARGCMRSEIFTVCLSAELLAEFGEKCAAIAAEIRGTKV